MRMSLSTTSGLGGEERGEGLGNRLLAHAHPVVGAGNADPSLSLRDVDRDTPVLAAFEGVDRRVDQQVGECAAQ